MKKNAQTAGMSIETYLAKIAQGLRHCYACQQWRVSTEFSIDRSRWDGSARICSLCMKQRSQQRYIRKRPPRQSGPQPHPPRDGDKRQARHRVNQLVLWRKLPHPNALPCVDCGHIWHEGERRHEYDHYLGYAAAHHEDVQVVCSSCHHQRDDPRMHATQCKHGHAFTPENTGHQANGTRICLECRRSRDRGRRGAEYWRAYRVKRKAV